MRACDLAPPQGLHICLVACLVLLPPFRIGAPGTVGLSKKVASPNRLRSRRLWSFSLSSHLYRMWKYKTDSGHEAAIASDLLARAKIAAGVATGAFEAGG